MIKNKNKTIEYDFAMQKWFLELMLTDPQMFIRVRNVYDVENFHTDLRESAEFMMTHSDTYGTLPDLKQIKAMTGESFELLEKLDDGHFDWFLDHFEKFTQDKALYRAVEQAYELLEKGDRTPIEKLIKDAVQISLTKDMGTDYFDDPRARLDKIRANNGQVSTGWAGLDRKLYGGFNRGELQIFAGGSGSGKSLFMQNLSVNWVDQGLSGVFVTLELNEELTAMRIDSMMTDISTKAIFKNLDDVELKVKQKAKKSGKFQIKYMPAQSNINDIRSYVRELQIQTGNKIDFICIDYLDLLMPVSAKVGPSDLFVKDKYVSEEIRNLAKELNVVMVTASQLNRSAVEEVEFDHSMISGGISKINTADNVFGIFTSTAMKERGKYQIQLMKTRSSAGVGSKVDLDFDVETLKISDTSLSGQSNGHSHSAANILSGIKSKSTVTPASEDKSSQLKNMLRKMKN